MVNQCFQVTHIVARELHRMAALNIDIRDRFFTSLTLDGKVVSGAGPSHHECFMVPATVT